MSTFIALLANKEAGKISTSFQHLTRDQLPPGDLLVKVAYSTLNYKDGLAVTGQPGILRKFPIVPGVDFSGTVEESATSAFKPGDQVIGTGFGLGETLWGGYSQYIRVPAEHVVSLPESLSLEQAMAIGTAGFTAMQCVLALEAHGLNPVKGEVVVTGASGGVGSIAIAILWKLGYHIYAATGRPGQEAYLRSLGATGIVDRAAIEANADKGLVAERWAGAIDNVGGKVLSGLFAEMQSRSSVAACGMAGGGKLETGVWPFILRGVNLLGISSMKVTVEERRTVWSRLAADLPLLLLNSMIQVEPLSNIHQLAERILANNSRGRIVIDVNR